MAQEGLQIVQVVVTQEKNKMTRYEKGFIEKCAEYGVDGRYLVKAALFGLGNNKEVKWYDGDGIKSINEVADGIGGDIIARYNKNPSQALWMMQFSDKNPNVVDQYTDVTPFGDKQTNDLTEEQRYYIKYYKQKLAAAMRKEKLKRILLQVVAERKDIGDPNKYKATVDYRYAVDDDVKPDRRVDGVNIGPMWQNLPPIDLSKNDKK